MLPCPRSLAKRCWGICKSLFILLLRLHRAAICSAQKPMYPEEREAMGEIHFLIEGCFKMLFIFSLSVNEPTVCNTGVFFYSPFASAVQILRLSDLSVHGPSEPSPDFWTDTAEVIAKIISRAQHKQPCSWCTAGTALP